MGTVYSYTKVQKNDITVSHKFIRSGERVSIIDGFLAHGEAVMGMARIIEAAGVVILPHQN